MIRNKQLKNDGTVVENGMNDFHFKEFQNFCLTTSKPKVSCDDLRNYVDCETKPAALRTELIEFFTKEQEEVLDVFAGKGSNLIICSDLGRDSCGIDASIENCASYMNAIQNDSFLVPSTFLVGDALTTIQENPLLIDKKFDFIIVDPPSMKQSLLEGVLLDTLPRHKYIEYLVNLMTELQFFLAEDRYVVLFLQDVYQKGQYLHMPSLVLPHIVSLTFVGMKIYYRDMSFKASCNKTYAPIINHFYALIFKNNG